MGRGKEKRPAPSVPLGRDDRARERSAPGPREPAQAEAPDGVSGDWS